MAEVTGPISTLPGSRHVSPEGAMCDDHPDRPAVARVQGETDSFGCEMYDLCQECLDAFRTESVTAHCDWCKGEAIVRPTRDTDEGLSGPVYYVCTPCYDKQQAAIRAEFDDYDYYDDYDEQDDYLKRQSYGPNYLDFITPDDVFDKGPDVVQQWQSIKAREMATSKKR